MSHKHGKLAASARENNGGQGLSGHWTLGASGDGSDDPSSRDLDDGLAGLASGAFGALFGVLPFGAKGDGKRGASASAGATDNNTPGVMTIALPSATSASTPSSITVAEGGTATIAGPGTSAVDFAGSSGTLLIQHGEGFEGVITGLSGSDTIDLADISFNASIKATFVGTASGGTLTVSNGAEVAKVELSGDYLSSSWSVSSDGNGGTDVVDPTGTYNWQVMKVGAGGFADGLDEAPDGTIVVRTDTNGAYLWNGTSWQQLVTSSSMPAAFIAANPVGSGQGVYEIQIAPSDSNIMYMMFDGYVFVSTNKGTTWSETSFAQVTAGPNDNYRWYGQKMSVDPSNPNIVYVGTPLNGLWVTTNGGSTWSQVTGIPTPKVTDDDSAGFTGMMFDPAIGGAVGGVTQTIFAESTGNGVYESTNGGSTWTLLSGGPTDVEYATVGPNGAYYVACDDNQDLWRYYDGAWTELTQNPNGQGIQAIAINPHNPNEIVIVCQSGYLDVSYDGGTTWSGIDWDFTLQSTTIPWEKAANIYTNGVMFLDTGGAAFSESNPNELIISAGTGAFDVTVPTTSLSGTIAYDDMSTGIENLVANEIIVPPGEAPILASWDRPFIQISNLDDYPTTYGPVASTNIVAGWSVDYASSDPSFLVGIADWWGTEESGYSTNAGLTWTPFATEIPGAGGSFMGGAISASTMQNFVWAPADGYQPYYTLNGGQTWSPVSLPGVTSYSDFDPVYFLNGRDLAADRVLANTFYIYDEGATDGAGAGLFETTNGGVSWTEVYTGAISGYCTDLEIMAVPGEAGNLFFTGGIQGNGTNPEGFASSAGFYFSSNQGASWTRIPNVLDVVTFGFGAAAPGQTYPSIYIVGYVNDVYGIWQSTNNCQSWTQIGTQPAGELDQISTISGDPNVFGRVYVGTQGGGYAYLSGGPYVTGVTTNPTSGAEAPGSTITFTVDMSESVTVSGGTPTLSLNDGGVASYVSGSGSSALTFTYKVASSDTSVSELAISSVSLNGATVQDSDDNAASLSGAVTSFANLSVDPPVSPVVSAIGESPASGDLGVGKAVSFTVTFSSAVTVSGGTPTLTLNNGGVATYSSGSNSTALTFTYTVGSSNTNVSSLAATVINLNGATIANSGGAAATLSLSSVTQTGPQVDTTTPAITAIAESPASGDLGVGKSVTFTLSLSDTVTVSGGTPTLTLNDGGVATYTSGSNSNALTFTYTVASSNTNVSSLTATAFNANGATIVNGAGTAATLSLSSLTQTGPKIDAITPAITTIAETPSTGDLGVGSTVAFTLTFSDAVTISGGTPTLTLNDGGTATYASGSGSKTLTFDYTVGASDTGVSSLAATAVKLGGATIVNGAGTAANLSLSSVTQSGPAIVTQAQAPSITSIVESPATGDVGIGSTVAVTVNFSGAVDVSGGDPTLTLNSGGVADYASGSGTTALTFSYTVQGGQTAQSLAVTGYNLNGATLSGLTGLAASLTALSSLTQTGPEVLNGYWLTGGTFSGSDDTTYLAASTSATFSGAGDTIWATSTNDSLTFNGATGAQKNQFFGNGATIAVGTNSSVSVDGVNDAITVANGAIVGVDGANNSITAGEDDTIYLNGGTGNTVAASDDTVYLAANVGATITGANDTIGATTTGDNLTLGGNGNKGGDIIFLGNGASVIVEANSRVDIDGANNFVSVGNNSTFGVNGSDNSIAADSDDSIYLNGGTGNSVTASDSVLTAASNVSATILGSGDTIQAAAGDVFTMSGAIGATVDISGLGGGTVTLDDYLPMDGDVLELLGGVGGYASSSAAAAALTGDGEGGAELSLGTAGTLHFVGITPSQLSASNFAIG